MRERKYKAYDKTEGKWLEPDGRGNEWPTLLAIGLHGLPISIDKDSFKPSEVIGWNRDHNIEIVEWTGLSDKNGCDVYEGDILDFDEEEWGDIFKPELVPTLFDLISDDPPLRGSISDIGRYRSVIGNRLENPELLGEDS